ncbi:MAG: ATP-binding protein, partial [Anaerolineales bacterium]
RFPPDPAWPSTRSRVIVPIRLGETILGLLDLHSHAPRQHARQDLIGLQSLADQLGIALRNAELYSEAVHARTIAEKADQIKTRLLANVSHELRTPLNVILGYAATALASPNPYQMELPLTLGRDLQQIYSSGEHLLRVINDLLDLSRAEINALELFPESIETRTFLEEVLHGLADGLPARPEVVWRLQLPERLPLIQADPLRLRQILLNLLNNAYKFTAQGEIILGAEITPPHLRVWVQDSGLGIPIDLQERIFEPFVTSLQARRHGEGVGLGLSITRQLVMLHGGSITLESQPDHGSTFHLYLPLPSLTGQTLVIPEATRPALVVIAAPDAAPASIVELSRRRGWAIGYCRTADDLSDVLRHFQPVALAWDLGAAHPSDWGLIQKIRAYPQLCQLPFILYGAEQSQASESALGLTNVLIKPLNRQVLLDTVNALRPAAPAGPVLIVDDDPQARELYQSLIAGSLPGYAVRVATGGAAALNILEEETPCLVILDLLMPEVDGFSVLEQLRARPQTRRVPVVVMSGKTLTFEDVRRLDQMRVTFQSTNILSEAETAAAFQRALADPETLPQPTSALVKRAVAYLHQNYQRPLSRQEVAAAIGVSQDYLSHIFRQELGLSPWDYLNRYRIKQARVLLRGSSAGIMEIAAQVGFSDLSYFNRVFRKHVGRSPGAYRTQGD